MILKKKLKTARKVSRKDIETIVHETLDDYLAISTIHGIPHVFDKKLWSWERTIWIFVCCALFSLAAYLNVEVYQEWQNFPVLTSIKTTGQFSVNQRCDISR